MILKSIKTYEEWKELTANPELHWKDGHSAKELAILWHSNRNDFPIVVKKELKKAFNNIELLYAIPEYPVKLPGKGGSSKNDLFVLAKNKETLIPIMIEGKAEESFDNNIGKWLKAGKGVNSETNRLFRITEILKILDLNVTVKDIMSQYYQLFHRTASCLLLADKLNAKTTIMMVNRFSKRESKNKTFKDFSKFIQLFVADEIIEKSKMYHISIGDVILHFIWIEIELKEVESVQKESYLIEYMNKYLDLYCVHKKISKSKDQVPNVPSEFSQSLFMEIHGDSEGLELQTGTFDLKSKISNKIELKTNASISKNCNFSNGQEEFHTLYWMFFDLDKAKIFIREYSSEESTTPIKKKILELTSKSLYLKTYKYDEQYIYSIKSLALEIE